MPSLLLDFTGQEPLPEDPETVWPEDTEPASSWDVVSTQAPHNTARAQVDQELHAPEPTQSPPVTMSITILTTENKGVKLELNLVRQHMQKLRDHTAALEDRVSNMEDDVVPLQREIRHMQSIITGHSAV